MKMLILANKQKNCDKFFNDCPSYFLEMWNELFTE